ncbi:hypothetical protein QTP88_027779 [Uroleucon formosanum]
MPVLEISVYRISSAIHNFNQNKHGRKHRQLEYTEPVFKKGIVYKGIYCPTLTNSFREPSLELSYQRYSHRQRQKSLIIVNFVDMTLKAVLAGVWLLPTYHEPYHSQRAIWTCLTMFANLTVCLLGWWKCFANNYLQWAAVFTWCFINIQGFVWESYGQGSREYLVWYVLFIVFVTYAMLPLPLRWCILAGCSTALLHILITINGGSPEFSIIVSVDDVRHRNCGFHSSSPGQHQSHTVGK